MKAIYKIVNKLNNKVYIGQSIEPENRWKVHKKKNLSYIGSALKKYGEENFTFEVIEWTKDYNYREKFWIQKYNSLSPNGYNLTPGGEGYSKLTELDVSEIRESLAKTKMSFADIAECYSIDPHSICNINSGKAFYNNIITYPIRQTNIKTLTNVEIKALENQLFLGGYKNMSSAMKDFTTTRTLLYLINQGNHCNSSGEYSYPIVKGSILTKEEVGQIENEVSKKQFSLKQIGEQFGRDEGTVSRINKGSHRYSSKDLKFPLR